MPHHPIVPWIARAHPTTTWTTSVCTGALLLAGAGVLNGVEATTHWGAFDELARLGAIPFRERVVRRGKIVTGAGVSAGIDMALTLARRIAGRGLRADPAAHDGVRPAAAVRLRARPRRPGPETMERAFDAMMEVMQQLRRAAPTDPQRGRRGGRGDRAAGGRAPSLGGRNLLAMRSRSCSSACCAASSFGFAAAARSK